MPQKIKMFLTNTNRPPVILPRQINSASLGSVSSVAPQSMATPKAPSALSAPIISRIHSVRPGCGSCGRH